MKEQIILLLTVVVVIVSAFKPTPEQINSDSGNSIATLDVKTGRITNGEDATEGQLPYQVRLSLQQGSSISSCGGSLIAPEWILSAAHCTVNAELITVYLGANNRTDAEMVLVVGEESIFLHEMWNPRLWVNDISLLKIPAIKYTRNIRPVKLPQPSSTSYPTYAGEQAIISGWGVTSDAATSATTNRLQWGRVEIIENAECAELFGLIIEPGKICVETQENLVSPCRGDSGGALVLESSGEQVGLVSLGVSECEKGEPAVFTRITSYMEWINEKTGMNNANKR